MITRENRMSKINSQNIELYNEIRNGNVEFIKKKLNNIIPIFRIHDKSREIFVDPRRVEIKPYRTSSKLWLYLVLDKNFIPVPGYWLNNIKMHPSYNILCCSIPNEVDEDHMKYEYLYNFNIISVSDSIESESMVKGNIQLEYNTTVMGYNFNILDNSFIVQTDLSNTLSIPLTVITEAVRKIIDYKD